jgi:hypothetical protein
MAETSKHQSVAQSFLDAHPVGTIVTASALLDWVAEHADGAVIKNDLLLDDPAKQINAVKRHLNDGGRSDAVNEDRRFQLAVEDAKRKTFVVQSHANAVQEQAVNAIGKSVNGALSPLKSSRKAIAAVKLDELPELEKQVLEMARENVEAMERAVKPTLAQEVDRIWVARLAQDGFTPEQARKIREALPEVTKLQKLLRATA